MLLKTLWVGLSGALLMFAVDMLLYYIPEDFISGPKTTSAEKINVLLTS